jgi:hypothetical protein
MDCRNKSGNDNSEFKKWVVASCKISHKFRFIGRIEMTDELELVHGSGNVFRDLGLPNPEAEQLKAILATKITAVLDTQNLSLRRAH